MNPQDEKRCQKSELDDNTGFLVPSGAVSAGRRMVDSTHLGIIVIHLQCWKL